MPAGGGAIQGEAVNMVTFTDSGSTWTQNTVSVASDQRISGGAIYLTGSSATTIDIQGALFTENNGNKGGGLYISGE